MHTSPLRRFTSPSVLIALATLVAASTATTVRAQVYYIKNGYHAQVTSYFCGAASMEMMLDTPTTTTVGSPNYNQNVVDLLGLSVNDGGTVAPNPFPNTPNFGGQASIYSLVHGGNFAAQSGFAGGLSIYNNPGYGPGTDPIAFVNGLNAIDNPTNANNGAVSAALGNAGNNGNHAYAYYNFTPTALGGLAASNTIASALIAYNVPASASINFGGHWIDVNGVSLNSGFITGFYVRDPWTGYALTQNQANKGLGKNTWLRYGYDVRANSSTRNGAWFNYFTPATNNANAGTGVGYSIEVEPQGPEPIDSSSAFGVPMTNEGAEINASSADADSTVDLGDTANLGTEDGFASGTEDSKLSDDMLVQMPGDDSTEGDWLVPYDDASGVSGFTLIDADTGSIDQATWFDTGDEMTLSQVDAMVQSEAAGNADPSDNFVPEPSCLALLAFGALTTGIRPRRKA